METLRDQPKVMETLREQQKVMETLREQQKFMETLREQQKVSEDRIIATIKKEKSIKIIARSRMTDSDFRSLCIAGYPLNDEFWSKIEFGMSSELFDLLKPVVERFTASALELLELHATAEVAYVQPLGRATIVELIGLVNEYLNTEFDMNCEILFETSMHMHGQSYRVKGQYDAVILDTITHVQVMSWEFKKLDADLTNSNIAQLAATMWHGLNVSREMTKCPKRAVGFLTSGKAWIMVTATLIEGEYKWAATPSLTTIQRGNDAAVDIDVCGQVTKLLCFAFFNARSLQEDASAFILQELDGPLLEDFNGLDGENGSNLPNDDQNDDDDSRNDGIDATPDSHGEIGTDKSGHYLRPNVRRRPLGNVDSNCTAPLTIRNVEKYDSMTWSQMPLDRFKTVPTTF